MPYFVCPSCGDQEKTVRMEITEPYDSDVNAGGAPEVTEVLCGCVLTAEQLDDLERGQAHITMERLAQFCTIYDVPVSTFVNDEMFNTGTGRE